jgi:hypothetical protein
MAEILDINRRRRKPKVPPRALLDAQIQFLADECASRTELLEGLPHVFAKLVEIVPHRRRAELSKSICYISHELDLTAHNLRTVLICTMVLFERYTAESAA